MGWGGGGEWRRRRKKRRRRRRRRKIEGEVGCCFFEVEEPRAAAAALLLRLHGKKTSSFGPYLHHDVGVPRRAAEPLDGHLGGLLVTDLDLFVERMRAGREGKCEGERQTRRRSLFVASHLEDFTLVSRFAGLVRLRTGANRPDLQLGRSFWARQNERTSMWRTSPFLAATGARRTMRAAAGAPAATRGAAAGARDARRASRATDISEVSLAYG